MKQNVNKTIASLWAKTSINRTIKWHPLVLHMLDVAVSADAILAREPETTRNRMAEILEMEWAAARPWLLIVIACHDLGKACPGFQCKWQNMTGIDAGHSPCTDINHAFVSQIALEELLQEKGWPYELAELTAGAVGCHHGERPSPSNLDRLGVNRKALGNPAWTQARRDLFDALMGVLEPSGYPIASTLSGPDFMLLAGLTSFSDWIGSNEEFFPYGTIKDCNNLHDWFQNRSSNAEKVLETIGWRLRTALSKEQKSFSQVFDMSPRPLQQAVEDVLAETKEPIILLVEAPMGEGKTEAAFFAHLELQRKFGHRGLYIALPTKATGNAMFMRTLNFLRKQGVARKLDLQLSHGAALLSDDFQKLRLSGIYDPTTDGEVRASEWFTHKKRALLSEYGVGTVDQAILPILPVRHNFVRLWGLANRVVVFDEIHAYDAYTGTLLIHLLQWLLALGSSIVLLSATLPPSIRSKLAEMVGTCMPKKQEAYPRISIFRPNSVRQIHFTADSSRCNELRLIGISPEVRDIFVALETHLPEDSLGMALVNTVQRAQNLYQLFPGGVPLEKESRRVGKKLPDGTEVYLFHARFPAAQRQKREEQVLKIFGESGTRDGRKILIATQVAEQSLDLDFDLIVTDLAPIDLILQRAGRLWRHKMEARHVRKPILIVAGLTGHEPPLFGKPLWWGSVYREDILLRTWILLHRRNHLTLPDEIDTLVQMVYEERVEIPRSLTERFEKALFKGEGDTGAARQQAHHAIIGLPDDMSWNQPEQFVLYNEDELGVHRTLMAQTRLGEESIISIPLRAEDNFRPEVTPDFDTAKKWFLRSVSLSRKNIVNKLRSQGVPEGWKKSPLLRNCHALMLDADCSWEEDPTIRMDDDLGFVYEIKEAK